MNVQAIKCQVDKATKKYPIPSKPPETYQGYHPRPLLLARDLRRSSICTRFVQQALLAEIDDSLQDVLIFLLLFLFHHLPRMFC